MKLGFSLLNRIKKCVENSLSPPVISSIPSCPLEMISSRKNSRSVISLKSTARINIITKYKRTLLWWMHILECWILEWNLLLLSSKNLTSYPLLTLCAYSAKICHHLRKKRIQHMVKISPIKTKFIPLQNVNLSFFLHENHVKAQLKSPCHETIKKD